MPSKSPAQKRLMQAAAHTKGGFGGVPQSVGKEFAKADKMKEGGLYANIHAKRERIAAGSGERMRKAGSEGAPTAAAFKQSAKTAKMKDGGVSLAVGRGEKLPTKQGAGLTAKGRAKYNAATGSHLKAPQPEGGARKDSFCARMGAVARNAKGDAPRAKASLKRWKCAGW
jgi:hypothetical protein